jgi:hypothetical protein
MIHPTRPTQLDGLVAVNPDDGSLNMVVAVFVNSYIVIVVWILLQVSVAVLLVRCQASLPHRAQLEFFVGVQASRSSFMGTVGIAAATYTKACVVWHLCSIMIKLPKITLFEFWHAVQDNFVSYTMQASEQANLDRIAEQKSRSEIPTPLEPLLVGLVKGYIDDADLSIKLGNLYKVSIIRMCRSCFAPR